MVFDLNGRDQNTAFANIDTLNRALHNVDRVAVAMIQGLSVGPAFVRALSDVIEFPVRIEKEVSILWEDKTFDRSNTPPKAGVFWFTKRRAGSTIPQ